MNNPVITPQNAAFLRCTSELSIRSGRFAISPDGQQIACGYTGDRVPNTFWPRSYTCIVPRSEPERSIFLPSTETRDTQVLSISYSRDGKFLACRDMWAVYLWETTDWRLVLKHPTMYGAVSDPRFVVQKGQELLMFVDYDCVVRAGGGFEGSARYSVFPNPMELASSDFSADGRWFAGASGGPYKAGKLTVVDVQEHSVAFAQEGITDNTRLAFHPDGPLLAYAYSGEVRIVSVPPAEGCGEVRIPKNATVVSLAFSPDGALLLIACVGALPGGREDDWVEAWWVELWDWQRGSQVMRLPDADFAAFCTGGTELAVGKLSGGLEFWSVPAPG